MKIFHKILALALLLSLLPSAALAKQQPQPDLQKWENIEQAKKSDDVVVKTKDGKTYYGVYGDLTSDSFSIIIEKPGFFRRKQELKKFMKDEVKEVRVKGSLQKHIAIGAAIGVGGGIGSGVAIESQSDTDEDQGLVTIGTSLLGALAGMAGGAVVYAAKKGKLIYQSA